jgi:hypothetical protein
MWINTPSTDEMRQHLEVELNQNMAVEQRFPSHPIDGVQLRAYRTNGSHEPIFGSNYDQLLVAARKRS